ncbi:hypothetical protein TNCT_106711 [Trichonephila clavata]|uniref:Uncharacterized protein n=1 Tax=Trichonephila clavata TaxID=2740835 RepID=A0A8X6IGU5_TRICU|nr:hypothetical protein TNCT_106711 [Trichonephila clavata]
MRKERRRHDDENVGRTRLVLPEGKTGSSGRGEHLRKYPPISSLTRSIPLIECLGVGTFSFNISPSGSSRQHQKK